MKLKDISKRTKLISMIVISCAILLSGTIFTLAQTGAIRSFADGLTSSNPAAKITVSIANVGSAGMSVSAYPASPTGSQYTAQTDTDGIATFPYMSLTSGVSYTFFAATAGCSNSSVTDTIPPLGQTLGRVIYPNCSGNSETTTWVHGIVKNSSDGKPVNNASIRYGTDLNKVVFTNGSGYYSISGVSTGNYTFLVKATNYDSGSFAVNLTAMDASVGNTKDFSLSPTSGGGGTPTPGQCPCLYGGQLCNTTYNTCFTPTSGYTYITGKVRGKKADGSYEALAGANVQLNLASTKVPTTSDGTYTITYGAATSTSVTVQASKDSYASSGKTIQLNSGSNIIHLDFDLDKYYAPTPNASKMDIQGIIRGPSGHTVEVSLQVSCFGNWDQCHALPSTETTKTLSSKPLTFLANNTYSNYYLADYYNVGQKPPKFDKIYLIITSGLYYYDTDGDGMKNAGDNRVVLDSSMIKIIDGKSVLFKDLNLKSIADQQVSLFGFVEDDANPQALIPDATITIDADTSLSPLETTSKEYGIGGDGIVGEHNYALKDISRPYGKTRKIKVSLEVPNSDYIWDENKDGIPDQPITLDLPITEKTLRHDFTISKKLALCHLGDDSLARKVNSIILAANSPDFNAPLEHDNNAFTNVRAYLKKYNVNMGNEFDQLSSRSGANIGSIRKGIAPSFSEAISRTKYNLSNPTINVTMAEKFRIQSEMIWFGEVRESTAKEIFGSKILAMLKGALTPIMQSLVADVGIKGLQITDPFETKINERADTDADYSLPRKSIPGNQTTFSIKPRVQYKGQLIGILEMNVGIKTGSVYINSQTTYNTCANEQGEFSSSIQGSVLKTLDVNSTNKNMKFRFQTDGSNHTASFFWGWKL